MIKRKMQKFIKTGKVKDYLEYKDNQKLEASKELVPGEKHGVKRRNNNKGGGI